MAFQRRRTGELFLFVLNIIICIYSYIQAIEKLLPPRRADVDPKPEVVDEADYEESDIVDVRDRSLPAGSFFDQGFASQFGEDEDDWEDEEEEEDDMEEPECRTQ